MNLDGVRVLDLTQYLSGPACTLLMAGLGADVIKVEPGPGGDASRQLPVSSGQRSSFYVQQNRGKRSVCVDLGRPEGHELVRDLALECDILIENYSAGVLERRGLGPDDLRTLKPSLIYASISAYGRDSSKAGLPGYDLIGQAVAGSAALTGEPEGAPLASGAPISDVSAGMLAFGAIMSALYARVSSGEGQFIDVSLIEPVFNMHPIQVQAPSVDPEVRLRKAGRQAGVVSPAGSFMGPDGWLVLQVLEPQWDRFCEAASSIGLADDPRFVSPADRAKNRVALIEVVEAWINTFPSNKAVLDLLEAHRVPAGPIVDPAEAHEHDWFWERGAIAEVDDPVHGTIRVPGFPIHTSAQERRTVEPQAPFLGEHNEAVFGELLGFDAQRVEGLVADGVLMASTEG